MKRAILYARCSTEEQGDDRHSIAYQISQMQSHPMLRSLEVVGVYSDVISGTTFERKSLGNILRLCRASAAYADYLFIEQWDRFGRDTEHHFRVVREFKEAGVEVNALFQMIDFQNTMWPQFLAMYAAASHSESIKISQRTKNGIAEANRQGYYTSSAPIGYIRKDTGHKTKSGNTKRILSPAPSTAHIIRTLYEMYDTGYDRADLRDRYMHQLGCTKSTFYRIFTNIAYAGYIDCPAHNYLPAERVKARHEAIISLSLFERVQQRIAQESAHTAGRSWSASIPSLDTFYLKGVIRCLYSRRTMTAAYSRSKSGRRYAYYSTVKKSKIPRSQNLPVTYCHSLILKALRSLDFNIGLIWMEIQNQLSIMKKSAEKSLRAARDIYTKSENRLTTAEEKYLDDEITQDQYRSIQGKYIGRMSDLNEEIEEYQSRIAFAEQFTWDEFEHLGNLIVTYTISSGYTKNKLLSAVFPDGFSIDRDRDQVRTPKINSIFTINHSISMNNSYIKIKDETNLISVPSGVEPRTKFEHLITDLLLLKSAVA